MHTLKQWAIAFVGVIAAGGSGMSVAMAADLPVQPYQAAPQYGPPPVAVYPAPPVVYGYAPPPVVYYDAPPVVVAPVYPRRYVYGYRAYPNYRGYYGYRGYGPYVARGYGYGYRHGRHWR